LLVFANLFRVGGRHTQIGQVDLCVDRSKNNLLELEHHADYRIEQMNHENFP